ncbi:MAG: roadblock/LC7 domain-containing protein [Candidatus Methanoperedens sp.]|nr:roadblock/LC7 domain-containing protein [Candidatus Methanoperedens sp.]
MERKMSDVYNKVLLDLKRMNGVKMIALAGRDGYLIGEHATEGSEMLTLMSANMLRAAETATNKLEKVNPHRVIVDYKGGKLITTSAGSKALISVMATNDAKLDPIIKEIEKTADIIKDIL